MIERSKERGVRNPDSGEILKTMRNDELWELEDVAGCLVQNRWRKEFHPRVRRRAEGGEAKRSDFERMRRLAPAGCLPAVFPWPRKPTAANWRRMRREEELWVVWCDGEAVSWFVVRR